ncbi:MAG: response regulator [Spirulinaceae cyanobacterium]
MQGTLSEIDIRSILQLIELGQRTGELFVEAYHSSHSSHSSPSPCPRTADDADPLLLSKLRLARPFWFVFFLNGQITYAADSSSGGLLRLRDYLHRYKVEETFPLQEYSQSIASTNAPEYAYLWLLLENHVLSPAQGRSIIGHIAQETLFDLLSLHQGSFVFETGPALAPQLTTLETAPLIKTVMKQVQQWKQFHPHIQSPDQCPIITAKPSLREALPQATYQNLGHLADGKTTLRKISRYLNRDILTIAKAIYPYVKKGWVQLNSLAGSEPSPPVTHSNNSCGVPHILCIDDDLTVGKAIEQILKAQSIQSTITNNPIQALSIAFQVEPDLIFCDIAMPQLDGYEICAMLRKSTVFRQTPIIMLTGKEGFIDRVRARMVGSTDYLTKPFGKSELLTLLEKYIGFGLLKDTSAKPEQTN